MNKCVACPEPASPRFLVDSGSHLHLWHGTAQWRIRQFQRPAYLYFSLCRNPVAQYRTGKPERLLTAFAFAQKVRFITRGMCLICPFTAQIDPFVSWKLLAQRTIACEQVK